MLDIFYFVSLVQRIFDSSLSKRMQNKNISYISQYDNNDYKGLRYLYILIIHQYKHYLGFNGHYCESFAQLLPCPCFGREHYTYIHTERKETKSNYVRMNYLIGFDCI
jgi:hypothetical protein